jgi:hypothetical protein
MPRSPRQFREKLADGESILAKMSTDYAKLVERGDDEAALDLHLRILRVEAMNLRNRAAIKRLEFAAIGPTLKAAAIVDGIGICEGCGLAIREPYAARLLRCRHALPIADGGGNEPENLALVCQNCDGIADVLLSLRGPEDGAMNRESLLAALNADPLRPLRE